MISCLLTSSTSPSKQRSAGWGQHWWTWASSWGVNDELQNIIKFKQSCKVQVQVQRFYQRDKTKSPEVEQCRWWLGRWPLVVTRISSMLLRNIQAVLQSSEILSKDKTKSWSGLKLSSQRQCRWWWERSPWAVIIFFKQTCQSHVLNIDETTIVLLESLADPKSNGIENFEINFLSEQSDSQKVFQLDWSDWEMELSFIVIKQTE